MTACRSATMRVAPPSTPRGMYIHRLTPVFFAALAVIGIGLVAGLSPFVRALGAGW